jgi:two-component system response regulator
MKTPGGKMRRVVLYAENEAVDLIMCERAFRELEDKIQFRSVSDGRSVMQWLEGEGSYANRAFFPMPQLLILDSKLGDMSGLDVLRSVRSHPRFKEMPVVLHVGSTPPHLLHEYEELGVSAIVEKESTCRQLLERIRELFDHELAAR